VSPTIKLSAPDTRGFWEIPVLFEDEQLLALDKPDGILTSPDRLDPQRSSLMQLLHAAIAGGKPWAQERGLVYLMPAHRLDSDTSGVLLLAKSKPALITLANFFGSEKPAWTCIALASGTPRENRFDVDAKIASHPLQPGLMRVDSRNGKKSKTQFEVLESFSRHSYSLLRCRLLTHRPHQIEAHLQYLGLAVAGSGDYGGKPLWLSRLKPGYRLKPGKEERPLIARAALHMEELNIPHPITGTNITITAPWPKDLKVAVKYLRQYAM